MRPSSSGRLKSHAMSRATVCWRGRSYCLPRGFAFTPEFLLLQGGSAAGVGPSQHQSGPAVPRARPRRMVLKALFMVPAVSDLSFVNGWQTGFALSPGLRPAVRRPVVPSVMAASEGPLEHHMPAVRTAPDDPPHGPGWPVRFIEHAVIRNRQ